MKPGTKWLLAIGGLLAINLIAAVVLMVVANAGDQSRVLPSYNTEAR
jgi:hypothetical protein